MRESAGLFEEQQLSELLGVGPGELTAPDTEAVAIDWIRAGGKRLRPFLTMAGYAVAKHGEGVIASDSVLPGRIPPAVRKLAVAIESMHKASLVHDDIEDEDVFRYGHRTVHEEYGVAAAINVGDYLTGLGYRLVTECTAELGNDCVADIVGRLSLAHTELCRGQGAELLWGRRGDQELRPQDVLWMYSLKTAPAFEVALYAGLRAAGVRTEDVPLKKFCLYLGEAYQIMNDLDDWHEHPGNKVVAGGDVAASRPTLLRALALADNGEQQLRSAAGDRERMREVYEELGVFDRAEKLAGKLRNRATGLARSIDSPGLQSLFLFIVRVVL
jgi:geranylgeranyl pyrophosphate synthase